MRFTLENNRTRLFDVFSHLETSGKVIQDDTQLEKLFTLLESSVNDEKSVKVLLSRSEVTNFFVHIENSKPREPFQALILGLRLAPHLFTVSYPTPDTTPGGVGTDAVPPWVVGVFEAALRPVAWEEGSVRNAWTLGLQTMCHTTEGLTWALSKGYLAKAVDLVYDSSMFVSTQAQALLVVALPALLSSPSQDSPSTRDIMSRLQSQLSGSLSGRDARLMAAGLSLVHGLCPVAPPAVLRLLHAGMDVLLTSQRGDVWADRAMSSQVIATLICLLSVTETRSELQQKLEALTQQLLGEDHIAAAMNLASQLLVSGGCECPDLLREVALLPLTVLLGDPLQHLDTTLQHKAEGTWRQRSAFSQALLTSINLTSTWSYRERCSVLSVLGRALHAVTGVERPVTGVERPVTGVERPVTGDTDGASWRQAVHNNTRIQRSLLIFCSNMYTSESVAVGVAGPEVAVVKQVFLDCLLLLRRPGLPVTVSMRGFECLAGILNSLEDNLEELQTGAEDGSDPLSAFAELLLQGLCDVRWEVRDTALTTLSAILQHATPRGGVVSWLASHQVGCQLWQSVSDGESYVRAAAVTSLTYLPRHAALWEQLTQLCTQEEVVGRLGGILREDTEGFPRRAVVALLCDWLRSGSLPAHQAAVRAAVNAAIQDLDWEVKLTVVRYWGQELGEALGGVGPEVPGYAAGLTGSTDSGSTQDSLRVSLTRLSEQGCLRCLLTGARDYDQSVQHEACTLLVRLQQVCKLHGLTAHTQGLTAHTDSNGETPAKRLKLTKDSATPHSTPHTGGCPNGVSDSGPDSVAPSDSRLLTVDGFLKELEELDVTRLLEESSESIDDYVRNPESLFEDILTSLAKDDDENAIDCY